MKRTARKGRGKGEKGARKANGDGRGQGGRKGQKGGEREESGGRGRERARREKVKNGAENGRGSTRAEIWGHICILQGKSGGVLIKRERRIANGREKSGKSAKNIEISKKIIFKTFDIGGGYGVMIYRIYKIFVQQVYELYE